MARRSTNNGNRLLYDPNERINKRLGAFSMSENEEQEDDEELLNSDDLQPEENDTTSEQTDNDQAEENVRPSGLVGGAVNGAKNIADGVAKLAGAMAKMTAFIVANPWIIPVAGVLIFIIFIIIILMGGSSPAIDGYYDQKCNFNVATVSLTTCGTEESTSVNLKDYVIGVTNELIKDKELDDDTIKAIMIVVKTNAMSYGSYDNSNKNLKLDDCEYKYESIESGNESYSKLNTAYSSVENYLYLSASYRGTITNLSSSNALDLSDSVITKMEELAKNGDGYNKILSSVYNSDSDNEEEIVYTDTLFIGDSRIKEMADLGVIDSFRTISGSNYNWFSSSAASSVNSKFKDKVKYNIIIWLGVNDLNSVNNFYDKYVELAEGVWKDHNIYIISLGPVDESKTGIKNASIEEFNSTMRSLVSSSGISNLKYVSGNYNIENYKQNGLLYSEDDYKKIYADIMSGLDNTSENSGKYELYNLDDNCDFVEGSEESPSYGSACEAMSLKTTALSKTDFISKVQGYYGSGSKGSVFAQNAGAIYDIATSNGINPELVVVRAAREGFSPGAVKNNYWGLGCTNSGGYNACITYSSFSDGVLGFVNNVSRYDSLSSMMSKYAYIGSNWFNPGGSGQGGCYYYPYIKKYMSAQRANEVASACAQGKTCSGGNCMKTTDEDQLAYSKWQVESMASERNKIFNIDFDNCEATADCTLYSQSDKRWGAIPLGRSSSKMSDSGCAVTSIAIGIACSGVELTIANFDAGKFINALNAGSCFNEAGGIYWGCAKISEVAPGVSFASKNLVGGMSNEEKINMLQSYDPNKTFIIVHYGNHYVTYTSVNGNMVKVKDPAGGKIAEVGINKLDQIIIYNVNK